MITAYLVYTIDANKTEAFEKYAKQWIPLVKKFGGIHHGYFLPHEGANNKAVALFSFSSLADYEHYRKTSSQDPECIAAYDYAAENNCILSYERSFLKPLIN